MRLAFNWICGVIGLLYFTTTIVAADLQQEMVMSSGRSVDDPAQKFLTLVYTEAFKRIGFRFKYMHAPWKRSSQMSDNGEVDGELARIYSYGNRHPNMVRVEESHYTSGFIALATDPTIHLEGWSSLKDTGYIVDYVHGVKGSEVNLPQFLPPDNLTALARMTQGIGRLMRGRSDIFVHSETGLSPVLRTPKIINSNIRIAGELEKFSGHAYLHKKHKKLAPQLAKAMKMMKEEGLFEEYRDATEFWTFFNDDGTIKPIGNL